MAKYFCALGPSPTTCRSSVNVSGADPHTALRVYGDKVLPELRGG